MAIKKLLTFLAYVMVTGQQGQGGKGHCKSSDRWRGTRRATMVSPNSGNRHELDDQYTSMVKQKKTKHGEKKRDYDAVDGEEF